MNFPTAEPDPAADIPAQWCAYAQHEINMGPVRVQGSVYGVSRSVDVALQVGSAKRVEWLRCGLVQPDRVLRERSTNARVDNEQMLSGESMKIDERTQAFPIRTITPRADTARQK